MRSAPFIDIVNKPIQYSAVHYGRLRYYYRKR